MTPLEQIEEGIKEQDWSKVIDGFTVIAGRNPVEKPKKGKSKAGKTKVKIVADPKEIADSIKQVATATTDPFAQFRTEIPDIIKNQTSGRVNKETAKPCKEAPYFPVNKNEFKDDGKAHKKDVAIDKLLTKGLSPTPRREPVVMRRLQCSQCPYSIEAPEGYANSFANPGESDDPRPQFVCERCIK